MHIEELHILRFKNRGKLPKGKIKLLSGLMPKIPDPVPELALEPSVN